MKIQLSYQNQILPLDFEKKEKEIFIQVLEQKIEGKILSWAPPFFQILLREKAVKGSFFRAKDFIDVHLPSGSFRIFYPSKSSRKSKNAESEGHLNAPMPGKIVKICTQEGEPVKKGDLLLILEAMKMEHKILSPKEGILQKFFFKEGDRVAQGEELVEVK